MIGEMARLAVGTDVVQVLNDIAPDDVVPHGAAIWAMLAEQHPGFFEPTIHLIPTHDEL